MAYHRLARLACVILLSGLSFASATPLENAAEVERLIALGAYGKKPVLWFAQSPEQNMGSGPKSWLANSGGRLSARGLDPWGRTNSAFGLPPGASGSAAVSGSTARSPINPTSGTALFFCRPGENSHPPMLLFCNADWGQPGYLSLRINEIRDKWELTLAVSEPASSSRATQLNFASMAPGVWSFIALTWQQSGDVCTFRYWAGSLSGGELTYGEHEASALKSSNSMFLLGGRRADHSAASKLPPLVFDGGLFSHFTLYDTPLPEETVQRIYLAAIRP